MSELFFFQASNDLVELLQQARSRLAIWSALALAVLIPIYYSGAGYYDGCMPWLSYTMPIYLSGCAVCEWACASFACLSVAYQVHMVHTITSIATNEMAEKAEEECARPGSAVLVFVGWSLCVSLLSLPSVVYAVSTSLPPQNVLGLGSAILLLFQKTAGMILFVVTAFIVPGLSKLTCHWARLAPSRRGILTVSARLLISLLIPWSLVVVLNQDCLAKWPCLWNTCQQDDTFDISYPEAVIKCVDSWPCTPEAPDAYIAGYVNRQLVQHSEVCKPQYVPDGRCPRAAIGVLGNNSVPPLTAC